MPAGAARAAGFAALHGALVAAAGAAAFTTASVAAGLLASPTLSALVRTAAAARAVAVLLSFVTCHNFSLSQHGNPRRELRKEGHGLRERRRTARHSPPS